MLQEYVLRRGSAASQRIILDLRRLLLVNVILLLHLLFDHIRIQHVHLVHDVGAGSASRARGRYTTLFPRP